MTNQNNTPTSCLFLASPLVYAHLSDSAQPFCEPSPDIHSIVSYLSRAWVNVRQVDAARFEVGDEHSHALTLKSGKLVDGDSRNEEAARAASRKIWSTSRVSEVLRFYRGDLLLRTHEHNGRGGGGGRTIMVGSTC